MGTIGTFGSFTAARMGIYASQASLNVTGNNIANINTHGYTRQRMDLVSLHSTGAPRYANNYSVDIGYGVLCESVSQLRDPYLDIRYRNENSAVGATKAKLDGLDQISHILDEVGDGEDGFGVIEAQLNEFKGALEDLHIRVGGEEYDTLVRAAADTLTNLFNAAADDLKTVEENQAEKLKEDISTVNSILTNIRELNSQIRKQGIHGDKALELRDARNVYIDQLSSYMKIDVTYSMEQIDQYSEVEKLTITIADSGNPPIELVNGVYCTQLTMPEKHPLPNPYYDATDPRGMKYIGKDGQPTDIKREAALVPNNDATDPNPWLDDNGQSTNDPSLAAKVLNNQGPNAYDPDFNNGMKYLIEVDPTAANFEDRYKFTDDPKAADQVNNAVLEGEDNMYLFQLEPLKDVKGHYMRDKYDQPITEIVDIPDTLLYGSLQSMREMLTEEGEFASDYDIALDPDANIKRGIPYYQQVLDSLARRFAQVFNDANQITGDQLKDVYEMDAGGTNFLDAAGQVINNVDGAAMTIADVTPLKHPANTWEEVDASWDKVNENLAILREKGVLTPEYENFYDGGVLFSNRGDGDGTANITAANISVSHSWSVRDVQVLNTKKPDKGGLTHSSRNDNIDHMIALMGDKISFYATDIAPDSAADDRPFFKGTFQEMFTDISGTLAKDTQITTALYTNYDSAALALDNDRSSVSGVDLNEEATSMMQYQKSYAAACRLLTTIDSMLDKLINGTAV